MKTQVVKIKETKASASDIAELTQGSALTMLGYLPEELHLYIEAIEKYVKNDTLEVFTFSGADLNAVESTDLPKDLNIFSIKLEDLKDVNQLAIKERFQYGFRWLDDVVSNSKVEG